MLQAGFDKCIPRGLAAGLLSGQNVTHFWGMFRGRVGVEPWGADAELVDEIQGEGLQLECGVDVARVIHIHLGGKEAWSEQGWRKEARSEEEGQK